VQELLNETEDDALARWGRLAQDALDTTINTYREHVAVAEASLQRSRNRCDRDSITFKSTLAKEELEHLVESLPDNALVDWVDPDEGEAAREEAEEDAVAIDATVSEEGMIEGSMEDIDPSEWMVPEHCIPIHTNVTTYNWKPLQEAVQFDCIMMDPPWALATANPTRGVSLGYSQLTDEDIKNLPIPQLQTNGLLFVWVINAKYKFCLDLFKRWGYTFVDEIVWVKMTRNRRLAKSHGFYLQHAKEVCLVAKIGDDPPNLNSNIGSDIIMSERRGQSQKPTEIYELIEKLVPDGKYLEIFARKNNLRDYWVSVGNEVTGTGAPEEDLLAIQLKQAPSGAVYGAGSNRNNNT